MVKPRELGRRRLADHSAESDEGGADDRLAEDLVRRGLRQILDQAGGDALDPSVLGWREEARVAAPSRMHQARVSAARLLVAAPQGRHALRSWREQLLAEVITLRGVASFLGVQVVEGVPAVGGRPLIENLGQGGVLAAGDQGVEVDVEAPRDGYQGPALAVFERPGEPVEQVLVDLVAPGAQLALDHV